MLFDGHYLHVGVKSLLIGFDNWIGNGKRRIKSSFHTFCFLCRLFVGANTSYQVVY